MDSSTPPAGMPPSALILATKLYIPPPRPNAVARPHLLARLYDGLRCKLTLVSAAAGCGKTTLLSSWAYNLQARATSQVAWLSLDAGDNDPARFLLHLVAALRTVAAQVGAGALAALQSPQPPPPEALLTALLNELAGLPHSAVLVLDDYHLIEAEPVDRALAFLVEHLPSRIHLVIATREDPRLSLGRLRARGHLNELRAADLRFTLDEAGAFLNRAMGLSLSAEAVTALEARTEGWVAGLQLAALSLQGQRDAAGFISTFTGGHPFVLDYLVEEVLHWHAASVQAFLLRTSILERMCGPLCEAVLGAPAGTGQATLEYLERANLFIVPLDNERRWYRYHHLFAELLRKRLQQVAPASDEVAGEIAALHVRASAWYEENGLEIEAFQHAAAANDIERAERLVEGKGLPLHLRGAMAAVIAWLDSLPPAALDARPSLWVRYAAVLLVVGQTTGVEQKLQAAEAALHGVEHDPATRNLLGQIAAARATLAVTRYQADEVIIQAHRALEYLAPENWSFRTSAMWTLGSAFFFKGDRVAAGRLFAEALALSQEAGDAFATILNATGLGQVQEAENQLYLAAETYRRVLQLAGEQPLQILYEAHLGLARISYEWNDLQAAANYGRQSLLLARQYDSVIDRYLVCEVFLARLKLARGELDGAAAQIAQAEQSARQRSFVHQLPDIAAVKTLILLRRGDLAAAEHLAHAYNLPYCRARVHLARGDSAAALGVLAELRQQAEAHNWHDERLRVMVLQATALQTHGEKARAVQVLADALALAEPGGCIRLFLDEGLPMRSLLHTAAAQGIAPGYTRQLLALFPADEPEQAGRAADRPALVDPLSERELQVLQHIAAGLTNQEIADRLHLSLYTVKVHARNIFSKLGVNHRTLAVARARELGILLRA